MKKLLGLSLMAWLLLLSGCAITREYGPYMGKVVEKETGEPIEGAVVLMEFDTISGNIGGMTKHYVDAVETLTNAKGEYLIPLHRITTFRTFEAWSKDAYAVIFKPGYGAFPGHREATVSVASRTLPENQMVVVELPKLKTKKEREDNAISNLWIDGDVPEGKCKIFVSLKKTEMSILDKGY